MFNGGRNGEQVRGRGGGGGESYLPGGNLKVTQRCKLYKETGAENKYKIRWANGPERRVRSWLPAPVLSP